MTKGQRLTAELRRYFSVGPRTRRYRNSADLHRDMIDMLTNNAHYPGYYSPAITEILNGTFGVALAYGKHVGGYRIDGLLRAHIAAMTPWQFAALLGQMVDASVTNTGEGELFFQNMARQIRTAVAA